MDRTGRAIVLMWEGMTAIAKKAKESIRTMFLVATGRSMSQMNVARSEKSLIIVLTPFMMTGIMAD